MPKALMEAASCGHPIGTFDMPGCMKAVQDGVTGFVVPNEGYKLFKVCFWGPAQGRQLRTANGTGGKKRVEDMFSLDYVIR
jgi:glycosyltransferase involved in cell wall biosynthesis